VEGCLDSVMMHLYAEAARINRDAPKPRSGCRRQEEERRRKEARRREELHRPVGGAAQRLYQLGGFMIGPLGPVI
jgi:hypothetical protein